MDEIKQEREYSIAATFSVERQIKVRATSVEDAARIALDKEFSAWSAFEVGSHGDDLLACIDSESELAVEVTRDDGQIEETWVSLAEDKDCNVIVGALGETRLCKASAIPSEDEMYPFTRHRRQWPTPRDNEDSDG